MNNSKFKKARILFLTGLTLTVGAILYSFKSSDKLQAVMLVILGLVITSGALVYVLFKTLKQIHNAKTKNNTPATKGSIIFTGLIEALASMFFSW